MNWGRASCLSGPRDKWKQPLEWKVDKCENPNVFSDDEQVSIKYSLWSIQNIEKVAINQHWSLWTSIWERATRSVSSKVFSMVISPSNDADTHLTLPHTSPESNPMFLQCQTHKLFSNVHLSVAFLLEDWNCPMHLSESAIWCSPTFLPFSHRRVFSIHRHLLCVDCQVIAIGIHPNQQCQQFSCLLF